MNERARGERDFKRGLVFSVTAHLLILVAICVWPVTRQPRLMAVRLLKLAREAAGVTLSEPVPARVAALAPRPVPREIVPPANVAADRPIAPEIAPPVEIPARTESAAIANPADGGISSPGLLPSAVPSEADAAIEPSAGPGTVDVTGSSAGSGIGPGSGGSGAGGEGSGAGDASPGGGAAGGWHDSISVGAPGPAGGGGTGGSGGTGRGGIGPGGGGGSRIGGPAHTAPAVVAHFGNGTGGGAAADSLSIIRQRIIAAREYPSLARRKGWEGRTTVRFRVGGEGRPEGLGISETSGNAALDRASLRAVERGAPYPAVEGWIAVPIVFRLEG